MNYDWSFQQAFFFTIGFAVGIAILVSLALLVNIIVTLFWLCKKCFSRPKSSETLPTTWTYEPIPAPRRSLLSMPAPSAPRDDDNIYTELSRF